MKTSSPSIVPGLILAAIVAAAALYAGELVPVLGGAPAALLLGLAARAAAGPSQAIAPGATWASKRLLQSAIVLLGAGLSLTQLWQLGAYTLGLIVAVVFISLAAIGWVGKRMGLPPALSALIAVGTSICGASAIAAASPVVRAKQDETAYAVSTIFTFNLIALVVYPALGQALDLPTVTYAVWTGTAVHDTASAVAAGYAYSDEAGLLATVVKLARTTLLIPVLFVLAAVFARGGEGRGESPWRRFPWFIAAFAGVALLATAGLIPDDLAIWLPRAAKVMLVVALAGVGLASDPSRLRSAGYKPLALGLVASVLVSALSLALALRIPSS